MPDDFQDTDYHQKVTSLQPRAFTVPDTLRLLSISRSHLYALALKGEVRIVKIGHRTLVPASEIDRLVSGGSA